MSENIKKIHLGNYQYLRKEERRIVLIKVFLILFSNNISVIPDERYVCVFVLPAALDVLDDRNNVATREKVDESIEKHFLDFKLSQDFQRFVTSLEKMYEELENPLM